MDNTDNYATLKNKYERKKAGFFQIGDLILGRYKILSELGQGAMGIVYKCWDETSGIEIALKTLPPELSHNSQEIEEIKENFQLISKLTHTNIAAIKQLEKDNSNGNYYLIMECCNGEMLHHWIKQKRKNGNLTLQEIVPVINQVADALDYAHKQKIIHRDIKPGNIIINADNEVKILDFGLAAQIHTSMTRVSMAYRGTSGTGPYMAPEQWEGRIQNEKADQYAFAAMTYEMLCGHTPFENPDASILREAVLKSKVQPLQMISANANKALLKALSKEPEKRFNCCMDFVSALSGKCAKNTFKKNKSLTFFTLILLLLISICGVKFFGKIDTCLDRIKNFSTTPVQKNTINWTAGKIHSQNKDLISAEK